MLSARRLFALSSLLRFRPLAIRIPQRFHSVLPPKNDSLAKPTQEAEGHMIIGFTCKKCQHRQYSQMSKQSYYHGVVIIRCAGCRALHLIADHLGWYDSMRHVGTLEDILREKGETVRKMMAVAPPSVTDKLEWAAKLDKKWMAQEKHEDHNSENDTTCNSCNSSTKLT